LLKEARHALQETEANLREVIFSYRENATEQRKKAKQELNELSARMKKFEDSMQKTVIRSPVNGIVKKLYLVTSGTNYIPAWW
jgi:membrane fusion protein, adhesin transport system